MIAKILMVMFFLLIVGVFAYNTDADYYGGKLFRSWFPYPSECSYVLPAGYSLVVNSTDEYAIKGQYNDYYLTRHAGHIRLNYSSVITITTFKDSCEAKGFAKKFFDETTPTFIPTKNQ